MQVRGANLRGPLGADGGRVPGPRVPGVRPPARGVSAYTRVCAGPCGQEKPLGQYRGASRRCKACVRAEGRRKRAVPSAKRAARDASYRRLYGLSLAEYERMARRQRWRCKVCDRKAYPAGTRLVVDHNHATGEVRGLLCQPCNSALGLMGEKPERLISAAKYLLTRGNYGDLHA